MRSETISILSRTLAAVLVLLCVALTDSARACEVLKHFGSEIILGFHFGDSPNEVFCQAESSSPNSALRLDLTNSCRGNRFIGSSQPLARQSFQNALDDLYAHALMLRSGNGIDRQIFSTCYNVAGFPLAEIISGSENPSILIAPFVQTDFVIENLAAFNSGHFQAAFGFTDNNLGEYERASVGLAFLIARMKSNEQLTAVTVDGKYVHPLWYLSSVVLRSYRPRTLDDLEKVRKDTLGFFKQVRDLYPGTIDQDDNWDLIIRRNPADLYLKFDERSGVVTISSKINVDGPVYMDDGTREIYSWVTAHRVRTR